MMEPRARYDGELAEQCMQHMADAVLPRMRCYAFHRVFTDEAPQVGDQMVQDIMQLTGSCVEATDNGARAPDAVAIEFAIEVTIEAIFQLVPGFRRLVIQSVSDDLARSDDPQQRGIAGLVLAWADSLAGDDPGTLSDLGIDYEQ